MPFDATVLHPTSLSKAVAALHAGEGSARVLAGGQSLIAAMKLGLSESSVLVDLSRVPDLGEITLVQGDLHIGAMATHAQIAASALVRERCPMLAALAGGIADQQIRNMGTLGGSLAHNDPAADWPCGLLVHHALVVTTQRSMAIDDFLLGIYRTALQAGEIITRVVIPAANQTQRAHYQKFEQKASRFALVGVAVAELTNAQSGASTAHVAVTGLGYGACRWLQADLGQAYPPSLATTDVHASSRYRAHLVGVLTRRAMKASGIMPAQPLPPAPLIEQADARSCLAATSHAATSPERNAIPTEALSGAVQGAFTLPHDVQTTWDALLSPPILQACIPGCERFEQTQEHRYQATVKLGVGMVSVRLKAELTLHDLEPPHSCRLDFASDAGLLGGASGQAYIRLEALAGSACRVLWQASPRLSGKLASLAGRLVQGLSQQLSEQFFERFGKAIAATAGTVDTVDTAAASYLAPDQGATSSAKIGRWQRIKASLKSASFR